jgi:hypothetical protein
MPIAAARLYFCPEVGQAHRPRRSPTKRNAYQVGEIKMNFERDFTNQIGNWGMYSYDRPAWLFWNAMMNGLMDSGYSQQAAEQWLRSKAARWMLDGDMGDKIEELAYEFAKSRAARELASIKECEKWAKEAA